MLITLDLLNVLGDIRSEHEKISIINVSPVSRIFDKTIEQFPNFLTPSSRNRGDVNVIVEIASNKRNN